MTETRAHKWVRLHGHDRPYCGFGRHDLPIERLSFNWTAVTCLRCLVQGGIIPRPSSRYALGRSGIGSGRPLR